MKRLLTVIGLILLVAAFSSGVALAADVVPVTCTVTPKVIAITVSDGSVQYGLLDLSASAGSPTTKTTLELSPVDTQTATNTGSIPENFLIKSSNALGGTAWTLVVAGSIGADKFAHQCKGGELTDWTDLAPLDTYQTLKTSVSAGDSVTFDLKIYMPISTTDTASKTITVTVGVTGA